MGRYIGSIIIIWYLLNGSSIDLFHSLFDFHDLFFGYGELGFVMILFFVLKPIGYAIVVESIAMITSID